MFSFPLAAQAWRLERAAGYSCALVGLDHLKSGSMIVQGERTNPRSITEP